jgi:hypothetical protein
MKTFVKAKLFSVSTCRKLDPGFESWAGTLPMGRLITGQQRRVIKVGGGGMKWEAGDVNKRYTVLRYYAKQSFIVKCT